jgi:hypothetical protein
MDERRVGAIRRYCLKCLRICNLVEANPGIGKNTKNIFSEDRYWHPFHNGKVLIWKLDDDGVLFVGAFYSLPTELFL